MKRHINLCTHSNGSKMETVITPTEIVEFAVKDGARAAPHTRSWTVPRLRSR